MQWEKYKREWNETEGFMGYPGTKESTQKGRLGYSLGTRLLCEPNTLSTTNPAKFAGLDFFFGIFCVKLIQAIQSKKSPFNSKEFLYRFVIV